MIKIRNKFINPKYIIEMELRPEFQSQPGRFQFIFFVDFIGRVEQYWGDYFESKEQAENWFKSEIGVKG